MDMTQKNRTDYYNILKQLFIASILIIMLLALLSMPRCNKEETAIFEERKDSFELVNSYVLDNFGHIDEREFVQVCRDDENVIEYLYNDGIIEISDEIKDALTIMSDAVYYNFNNILVEKHRITYGGDSYRQYVYSRDGKVPDYYYYKGDGMHMTVYNLPGKWSLLVSASR